MADDGAVQDETKIKKDEWGDTDKNYYAATISLINGSEAVTWTRLTSFGFLAGFLANAIASETMPPITRAAFAAFGCLLSIAYIFLVVRSRKFVGPTLRSHSRSRRIIPASAQ